MRSSTSTGSGSPGRTSSPRPLAWRRVTAPTCPTSRVWAAATVLTGRSTSSGLAHALVSYCDAVGVERATFVGNSLGCPIIIEVATTFPDRIERAVLVSPAGGPNNQPFGRALWQMAIDSLREPVSMVPIAVRDYLRFGVYQGWSLFKAMTRYPTLERLRNLLVPTLVIAGDRDPLVRIDRASVFAGLPYIDAVKVPGAHALNYSSPELIAALIEAHLAGQPLHTLIEPTSGVEYVAISAPTTAQTPN